MSTESSCDFEVFLDVFLQILLSIILHQLDLLELHSLNEGGQTSQGLFTTSTDTHQQCGRSWLFEDTVDLQ